MFEALDSVEVKSAGRPYLKRTDEIYSALVQVKAEGKKGLRMDLAEDEIEQFHRFTHRARSAAKRAGVAVSVGRGKDGYGIIKIKEGA